MFDYRDLAVWRKSRRLVHLVYELTSAYPATERFGLVVQTRRASISVAANLAEGSGRRGSAEFARFVDIATGSAYELECHLLLAHDVGVLEATDMRRALSSLDEVKRMLIGLSRSLRAAKTTE